MTTLERFLQNHPAFNRAGSQELTTAVWGGIAQEFDALKIEIKKITQDAEDVENLAGDELDEVILAFTGIARMQDESDAMRLRLLNALFLRGEDKSWNTVHSIRQVFRWWFADEFITIKENEIVANEITDGGFETETVGEKTTTFGEWTPYGTSIYIENADTFEGARVLHAEGDGWLSCEKAVTAGMYILSFAYKGYLPIRVKRTSDSYYWNFSTREWQSSEYIQLLQNDTEHYQVVERPILSDGTDSFSLYFGPCYDAVFDGGVADTIFTEELDGGAADTEFTEDVDGGGAYHRAFRLDMVSFGAKPGYPYIHVIISTFAQNGEFLNAWVPGEDPIAGTDYDYATFFDLDFIGGDGSGTPTEYYQKILNYIKPAGVKAVFEFVGRV